ncbi:unnamed protein product [Adineta ricciae]|uniref:Uncharacterized protein n=1 Tax=Adineta ricciae TaxID=249248 RepID=A0A813SE44_ADIRI|nr:unnamed protein product [Adineta ricciae]CAF1349764.1 unnamed protein product [Adineta ricciae]
MTSATLIDHYNSHNNFDKLSQSYPSLAKSASDYNEYEQKLRNKVEHDNRNDNGSFLDTIEGLRREQRVRLVQAEHDYYNQLATSATLDLPSDSRDEHISRKQEKLVTSKPPLPKASRSSAAPVFLTEQRAQHRIHHRPTSVNIVRRHDEEIAFCPHRTSIGNTTTTVHDLTTDHVRNQIKSMWNEFELEDYLDQKKNRHSDTAASWAGRITVPEPFSLTNSMNMDSVHRRKCMYEIEAAKLQKEVDDEVHLSYSFKANTVPAHVHLPLYEQMQEDQRLRSENTRQMTKEYLASISKPFAFESREKAKTIIRRHSFADGDLLRSEPQFKAKPLPDFYYQQREQNELSQERELQRSFTKDIRAKELLRQSRLPFSSTKPKFVRRSKSANDAARFRYQEHAFKPKTNGYYVPNYDKNYEKFLRSMEERKRTRSPTKCKPFLLYTNMIPSKKDKILDDIRNDAHMRHARTFQIKGKQMPTRSASIANLSVSLQQSEPIPTKTTEAQRLREAVGKKKRREEEVRNSIAEVHQRSKSAKDRRVRETIRQRGELQNKTVLAKAKRDENTRRLRQSIRRSEDDYAKRLDEMKERVQQRPLLLEQDSRKKAVRELERKIQQAMNIANVTEDDLRLVNTNLSS